MRAMLTLAASLAVCAGLFGCDDDSSGQKTSASVIGAASAAPACKCKQTAKDEPAHRTASVHHHWYPHHAAHHTHFAYRGRGTGSGHSWYEIGWGSNSHSTGSYSESSHSEYAMADQAPDNMPPPPLMPPSAPYPPPPPGAGPGGPPAGPAMDSGVWVDGYGRGHFADGETPPSPNDNAEYLSNEDSARRHDVWRGYNSKCRNAAVD